MPVTQNSPPSLGRDERTNMKRMTLKPTKKLKFRTVSINSTTSLTILQTADKNCMTKTETNGHKIPEDALDKRLRLLLLDSSQLDPADYSGKNRDEEFRKISSPLIKQEDANKYRCRQCSKLFKAPEFLHKHIPTKHPELFGTLDVVSIVATL